MPRLFLALSMMTVLLSAGNCFAQPGGGGPTPPVPISGLEWLLVAGGILGVKKIFDSRKKN